MNAIHGAGKVRAAKKVSRHKSRRVTGSTISTGTSASLANLRTQLDDYCEGLETQLNAARSVLSILK